MPRPVTLDLVQETARRMQRSRHVHGVVLAVQAPGDGACHVAAAGNLAPGSRFFAASVTKILVTIVVMRLVEAGRITLDDPIADHLPRDLIRGLHVMDGVDRTGQITVRHLLSNQSGLRDYFSLKGPDGRSYMSTLLAGEDAAWPLERTLEAVRGQRPQFLPGQKGKVAYSDTNYQLLGRILENVTGQPVAVLFAGEVFAPLALSATGIFTGAGTGGAAPAPIHAGPRQVHLPRYIASIPAEGGMVTTGADLLRIGQAFFSGRFFNIDRFLAEQDWRLLFWPGQFHFGLGLEKLWTPWFISPRRPIRDVMGFWGQTGAFLFHHPSSGLHLAGTVNQASGWGHAVAVRGMLRIIRAGLD